jgi:hypothetical protein
MLHGNCTFTRSRHKFSRRSLRSVADQLTEREATLLLDGPTWREHLAVSWFIGMRRWDSFVPRLGDMLLRSERTYEGQGFVVGLAALGGPEASDALVRYLDHWLPKVAFRYDQAWAMAALIALDDREGTDAAAKFLTPGGVWETWCGVDYGDELPPVAAVLELIGVVD